MASPAEDLPRVPGVQHRFAQLRGMRMHLAEAGEGPPLLLLHGWPQHWWCFRRLIPQLSRRFRVIAPDLRGLGWSDAPPDGYSKAQLAADVLELLDREGIGRVSVIGHDWGGFVAFLLALEHPERIVRLMALDIPPPWLGPAHPRQLALPILSSYQALLATPLVGEGLLRRGRRTVRAIIRLASGPHARWSNHELDVYADCLRQPARAHASSAYYRTFLMHELPRIVAAGDRSHELTVPALLLMGESSAIDRVLAPRPAGMLQVRRVPSAGHFLAEEDPRAVLSAAGEWFDSSVSDPASAPAD
jgi:pimeloyl-ACP methyl ester carboxylesterase